MARTERQRRVKSALRAFIGGGGAWGRTPAPAREGAPQTTSCPFETLRAEARESARAAATANETGRRPAPPTEEQRAQMQAEALLRAGLMGVRPYPISPDSRSSAPVGIEREDDQAHRAQMRTEARLRAELMDSRARASSAAAEVRAARAAATAATRQRETDDKRTDNMPRGEAWYAEQLAREERLLGRMTGGGAVGEVFVRMLELREGRAEEQKRWERALDDVEVALAKAELEDKAERKTAGDTECVIDLGMIEKGELVVRLPCFHVFHEECIMPYLTREEHPLCPIDRAPVRKTDVPLLPVWRWGMS